LNPKKSKKKNERKKKENVKIEVLFAGVWAFFFLPSGQNRQNNTPSGVRFC